MDILKKYASKKKIFMAAFIYSAIYTALCVFMKIIVSGDYSSSDLSAIEAILTSLASIITVIQILFYVMLVVAIIIAVLAAVYFFTKDKKDYIMLGEFIGFGLSGALLLFSASGMNAACKVIKVMSSGDYSSLYSMDYTSMMSSMQTAASCLNIFNWVVIILFILNLIVFLIMKGVIKTGFSYNLNETVGTVVGDKKIVSYDPQTGAPIYEDVPAGTASSVNVGAGVASAKAFFTTKNGKITIGIIALIIVAFGGYKIYDVFLNKTPISLLDNVQVEFTGFDGAGRISSCIMGDVEYDKTNAEIADFVSSIRLDYEYDDDDLKNGDKVTINAVYDQTRAKELKLNVKNATTEVTVEGLIERYTKASKVPSKTSSAIKKLMDAEMQNDYDERTSTYYSYKTSFVSMYYAYDAENSNSSADYCIGIYKIDYTYNYGSEPKSETYYAMAYISGINSSYSSEITRTIYTSNLYASGSQRVTDESQVEDAIKKNYRFSDHELSKF